MAEQWWKSWWAPLVVPAVVLAGLALDLGSKGTHVSHSTYGSGLLGAVVIAVVVGYPAFAAGVRYARSMNSTGDHHRSD